jgi:hypothetical protein
MKMINVSELTRQKRTDPSCAIYQSLLPAHDLYELIHGFEPISLREMDSVALLKRVDTKFVLSADQLRSVLRNLCPNYQVLSINHRRIHRYWTLYFDTHGFELYHDHVTGRAEIYKVRSREYLDTHLSYLEVKHKDQKRRTEKIRLPVSCHSDRLDEEMDDFLDTLVPYSAQGLEAKLWNTFKRITLVNQTDLERLTIDMDLCFFNQQRSLVLDGIAIAEIKQEKFNRRSAFAIEMRRLGIRQTGFSKYCFGVAQLYSTVKRNSQKRRALMIDKLQRGGQAYVCNA